MGSSLFKALYPKDDAVVALLNIGSEELKGNEIIKKLTKTYKIRITIFLIFMVILKAIN